MRALICNIVPKDLIKELSSSQAAYNFCETLLVEGVFDEAYSLIPYSKYDARILDEGKIKFFSGKEGANNFSRLVQHFKNCWHCAFEARKADTVWFYNLNANNLLVFILLNFIFHVPCYSILLDYTPSKNSLSLASCIPWFFSKSCGVISLSERITPLHSQIGYKAGVIKQKAIRPFIAKQKSERMKILFSGCIDHHTGFPLAFNTIKELPQFDLYITGFGDVTNYDFDSYPHIHYLGTIEFSKYLQLLDEVDVCLSLRNPDFEENHFNFPSKIIEYFCHQKIVVSTIEYPELNGFAYFPVSYAKEALAEQFNTIHQMSDTDLQPFQNNNAQLLNCFSTDSWKKMISKIEKK